MPLVALKPMRYGTRQLKPGDRFEASSAADARLLRAIGRAKDAPAETEAEAEPEAAADAPRPTRRGRYARRDLLAED